ncbi:MAG: ribonuclease H-like domain-containing protein [Candidatus Thermoplasmatota archaeon]|nr:ribonuclease H-like domain-containing protein [Candidatus Thermoplasmatota archaeon]
MTYHIALDIETTSLYADDGMITCYAVIGEDNIVLANVIKDVDEEKKLLRQMLRDLVSLNVRHPTSKIITYNGHSFDYPMIITRLLNLNLLPELAVFKKNFDKKGKHIDLYWVVRNNFLLKSRKLTDVCRYIGIEYEKGKDSIELWENRETGTLKRQCINDARVLHMLRKKFVELNIMERR